MTAGYKTGDKWLQGKMTSRYILEIKQVEAAERSDVESEEQRTIKKDSWGFNLNSSNSWVVSFICGEDGWAIWGEKSRIHILLWVSDSLKKKPNGQYAQINIQLHSLYSKNKQNIKAFFIYQIYQIFSSSFNFYYWCSGYRERFFLQRQIS